MYNKWICINAYLEFLSIFIIGPIHNQQVCTKFISLSYSSLNGTLTYYILLMIFKIAMVITQWWQLWIPRLIYAYLVMYVWPKNGVKCFLWMKAKSLVQLYGRDVEAMVFQGHRKVQFLFFCFWLGLLFCKLLWSGFGELISVMEHNPGCSMDTFYEQCESQF